ncbi:MAG: N-6 DNA methylase [Spirochaetales bacterium]|nr:N-6 DNA methylase [Spirochaetales bacterium]
MDKKLTLPEAACALGVSPATIQNWQRGGTLGELTESTVKDFLNNPKVHGRLTSRANKRYSTRSFSPSEYGGGKLKKALAFVHEQNWTLEEALFYAQEDLTGPYGTTPENRYFREEMESWAQKLFSKRSRRPRGVHYPAVMEEAEDFPGWLYQALQQEGDKAVKGSYFTPPCLVEDILDRVFAEEKEGDFFDPCCGSGGFLLPAARRLNDPTRVAGQDSDPLAVKLARLNLMRLFPEKEFNPAIYRGNSLKSFPRELAKKRFRFIATNPPWGSRFTAKEKNDLSRRYKLMSGESASLIILSSLRLLHSEGRAAYLLPESLLHRQRHGDIRERILDRTTEIAWYGKRFSRVQSECFCLTLNGTACREGQIRIDLEERNYLRSKDSFRRSPLDLWNVFTSEEERGIFAKLFEREHRLLGDRSRWGLGIVTGDNRGKLNSEGKGEEILRGKDLLPFSLAEASLFLDYHDKGLQQKAPLELYKKEKIVYRFIASRPCAALDLKGRLTLNSVNILIPGEEIDPKLALLFLNSELYGLYFEKTFHTLKVLRGQLATLPIPVLNEEEEQSLKELYPLLCSNFEAHRERWNGMIYDIFNISHEERISLERV